MPKIIFSTLVLIMVSMGAVTAYSSFLAKESFDREAINAAEAAKDEGMRRGVQ